MSELINSSNGSRDFRWKFLTTVSALALTYSAYTASEASAADEDGDHPTVWIELGGQLERMDGGQTPFAPPFTLMTPTTQSPFEPVSPLEAQNPPKYSVGAEGKISFEPAGTNWVFSAAVRYGRSNGFRHVHEQSPGLVQKKVPYYVSGQGFVCCHDTIITRAQPNFVDTRATHSESHAVIDFQVGKDVGLGMFGNRGASVLSLGVRFAQFVSKTDVTILARPDREAHNFFSKPSKYYPSSHSNIYSASAQAKRSFRGVGPSISWNASAPVLGNPETAQFAVDWGAAAAILLGRQMAVVHHSAIAHHNFSYGYLLYQTATDHNRERSVAVPNVGGFAGLSLKFPNAKISLGYRADFFFGTIDGGIDTAKRENVGFYGPFATISIGLGR